MRRLSGYAVALFLITLLVTTPHAFGETLAQTLSVRVVSVISPVRAGSQATLTVKTSPGAQCTPSVQGRSGATVKVFPKRVADAHGMATWTWQVPVETAAGPWPVTITCVSSSPNGTIRSEASVKTTAVVR